VWTTEDYLKFVETVGADKRWRLVNYVNEKVTTLERENAALKDKIKQLEAAQVPHRVG